MFLLPGSNAPIPLSHNGVCKTGDRGGRCCNVCPSHHLGGPMEWRGQPERGGGRNTRLPDTQLLGATRDGEEEGVTCLQPQVKQRVCRLLSLQPFLLHQFKRAQE